MICIIFNYIFNYNIINYKCEFERAPHMLENTEGPGYLKIVVF